VISSCAPPRCLIWLIQSGRLPTSVEPAHNSRKPGNSFTWPHQEPAVVYAARSVTRAMATSCSHCAAIAAIANAKVVPRRWRRSGCPPHGSTSPRARRNDLSRKRIAATKSLGRFVVTAELRLCPGGDPARCGRASRLHARRSRMVPSGSGYLCQKRATLGTGRRGGAPISRLSAWQVLSGGGWPMIREGNEAWWAGDIPGPPETPLWILIPVWIGARDQWIIP
jgi:hypothetical protein